MRNYANIDKHLDILERDIYPEPEMQQHDEITEKVFREFIVPNARFFNLVLDVGCGKGIALRRFRSLEISAVGITLGHEDYKECLKLGFNVRLMDQSFLDFSEATFDLVYARHVLEHSPFPLLTLFEFNRVLKKDAFIYIEVPWAESIHTSNPNHYSMLGKMAWRHLFDKARFSIVNDITINFTFVNGKPDEYWGWWLRKSENLSRERQDNIVQCIRS